MANQIQTDAAIWDQVWAEYDTRRQQEPARIQPVVAPTRQRPAWGRRLRGLAALCIVLSATAYAVAPVLAAARMGEALASGDALALEAAVDWSGVGAALNQEMATATQGHSPAATAFLQGMVTDVAQGLATPAGLMGLLRGRLPGRAQGVDMIGAVRPLNATHLQVALHAPGDAQRALSVTLALHDPLRLRWRVVGMVVAPAPLPDWGG